MDINKNALRLRLDEIMKVLDFQQTSHALFCCVLGGDVVYTEEYLHDIDVERDKLPFPRFGGCFYAPDGERALIEADLMLPEKVRELEIQVLTIKKLLCIKATKGKSLCGIPVDLSWRLSEREKADLINPDINKIEYEISLLKKRKKTIIANTPVVSDDDISKHVEIQNQINEFEGKKIELYADSKATILSDDFYDLVKQEEEIDNISYKLSSAYDDIESCKSELRKTADLDMIRKISLRANRLHKETELLKTKRKNLTDNLPYSIESEESNVSHHEE